MQTFLENVLIEIVQKPYCLLLYLQSRCSVPCWGECRVLNQLRSISWSTVRSPSPLICAAWWGRRRVSLATTCWQGWTPLAWLLLEELASKHGSKCICWRIAYGICKGKHYQMVLKTWLRFILHYSGGGLKYLLLKIIQPLFINFTDQLFDLDMLWLNYNEAQMACCVVLYPGTWQSGWPTATPVPTSGHWTSNALATCRAAGPSCDTE